MTEFSQTFAMPNKACSEIKPIRLFMERYINPIKDKVTNMKVKEGDLLAMPAYVWHRSPPNVSDKRKTVIVFNSEAKANRPFEHRIK